ncbi:acetyltransferase [Clostridium lundense]|uniref:acetyltransferase n=1 Tax=Clostridium lundense TaxID=319475 RepID=UPI0004852027|nr:acetyltransferase [Clostridium lundense]
MEKIVLIGAGGHCKVIIDIIKSTNKYEIIGITDNEKKGYLLDIPIIGNDDVLSDIYSKGVKNAFICIGALNDMKIREKIFNNLKSIGFKLPILKHKNSIVSLYAEIGEGNCIMAGAIINAGARIESNCIINTASIIEHDCKIGFNCHISPNASIGGNVTIGHNSHIGIGSIIIQNVNIGSNVTIGAGSVVINNIDNDKLVVGIPGKVKKYKK